MSQALDQARHIARSEDLQAPDVQIGASLIDATREKYRSDHSNKNHKLKRSTELNAYLRLLSHPRVFPFGALLQDRLSLCLEILEGCQQRPVLEQIGLTLLQLDFQHGWTSSHAHVLTQILDLDKKQSRHRTVPMLALCMHHSQAFAKDFASRIAESDLNDKKTRVGELIETLDVLPEDEPLDDFVDLAYEAIFARTSPEQKSLLLQRVIRECLDSERTFEHERWMLLIDPIIAQNLHTSAAIEILDGLMDKMPGEHATRYLVNYTMVMAEHRRKFSEHTLKMLEAHAPASLIAYLYPSTLHTERGAFGERKSAYANRVEQVIEAIVEREQIDRNAGGLSLAEEGAMGGLTVLDASHGTLSVEAPARAMNRPDPSELLPPIHDAIEVSARTRQLDPSKVIAVLVFMVLLAGFVYYVW